MEAIKVISIEFCELDGEKFLRAINPQNGLTLTTARDYDELLKRVNKLIKV